MSGTRLLRNCAHCRSSQVEYFVADDTPRAEVHGVICGTCGVNVTRPTREAAAEAWNRREKRPRTVIDGTKETK